MIDPYAKLSQFMWFVMKMMMMVKMWRTAFLGVMKMIRERCTGWFKKCFSSLDEISKIIGQTKYFTICKAQIIGCTTCSLMGLANSSNGSTVTDIAKCLYWAKACLSEKMLYTCMVQETKPVLRIGNVWWRMHWKELKGPFLDPGMVILWHVSVDLTKFPNF